MTDTRSLSVNGKKLFKIAFQNDAEQIKSFLHENHGKELYKEQNEEGLTIARYIGKNMLWNAMEGLVDYLFQDKEFNDSNNEYQIGSLLLLLARTKYYNGTIPRHELVRKLIRLQPSLWFSDEKLYPLHIAIRRNPDRQLIEAYCESTKQLNAQKDNNPIPLIYAAKESEWEVVEWIAKKNPQHFAKHANDLLTKAIKKGNLDKFIKIIADDDILKEYIKQNSVNIESFVTQLSLENENIFYLAAKNGHWNIINALADFLISNNIKNQSKNVGYALYTLSACDSYSASTPPHELAKKLISLNADIFKVDGKSALHAAIKKNKNREFIEALCEQKDLIDQRHWNNTPIMSAAELEEYGVVKWIAHKDPQAFAKYADEFFRYAFINDKFDELVKIFSIDKVINTKPGLIDLWVKENSTHHWLHRAAQYNCVELFKQLIEKIKDPEKLTSPHHEKKTILELACEYSSWDCAEIVALNYCQMTRTIQSRQNSGTLSTWWSRSNWHLSQALFWTVKNNNYYLTELFLHNDPDCLSFNDSPKLLCEATRNGNHNVVTLLLNNKAQVNVKEGESPLQLAIDHALKKNEKLKATITGNEEHHLICQLLLKVGALVNAPDGRESPLLIKTVKKNDLYLTHLLLDHGAVVNVCNEEANQLLQHAVKHNNHKMIALLLNKQAPVNIKENRECPALITAIAARNIDIINVLLAHGAAIQDHNQYGNKALYQACQTDDAEIVNLLLIHGADPDQMVGGSTMDVYCEQNNKPNCARVITQWVHARFQQQSNYLITMQSQLENTKIIKKSKTFFGREEQVNYTPPAIEEAKKELDKVNWQDRQLDRIQIAKTYKTVRALIHKEEKNTDKTHDAQMTSWLQTLSKQADDTELAMKTTHHLNSNSSSNEFASSDSGDNNFIPPILFMPPTVAAPPQMIMNTWQPPILIYPTAPLTTTSTSNNPIHTTTNTTINQPSLLTSTLPPTSSTAMLFSTMAQNPLQVVPLPNTANTSTPPPPYASPTRIYPPLPLHVAQLHYFGDNNNGVQQISSQGPTLLPTYHPPQAPAKRPN